MASEMPTVCVDLDGVLNLYDGWRGAEHFPPPRPGAAEFMERLARDYRVVVLTTREPGAASDWLYAHAIPFDDVTALKPPAIAYVDDRAICFEGSFEGLAERVAAFKAHWQRRA